MRAWTNQYCVVSSTWKNTSKICDINWKEIKRHGKTGISKRELSKITGINHNSIVKWRNIYKKEGIEPLLTYGRIGGFKRNVISKEEHAKIEKKLNDPKNGIRGYTELLDWVQKSWIRKSSILHYLNMPSGTSEAK